MGSLLDKAIAYISPEMGARRAAHRRRIEILEGARGYEAAASGRISKHRHSPATSVDGEIGRAGQRVRDRARDSVRNNPLAAKIVAGHADNLFGFGITPRAKTGSEEMDKKTNELFDEWSKRAFAGMATDFFGGGYLLIRMMAQDGEVYVRKRTRLLEDGFTVPLQLQILDAEFCDWSRNPVVTGHPTNVVVQGVEFDAIGNRTGYWMFPNNPRNGLSWAFSGMQSGFVPASDIVHLYEPQNNQVHGISWLSPVLNEIDELKDYEIAEGVRKKTEACMVGMIVPGDDAESEDPNVGIDETEDPDTGSGPTVRDVHGFPLERMEPGMFGILHGGKDIRFNTPAISAGMEAFIRTRHRSISAGARIPYEIVTGDFSQSNFASGKLGIQGYQRFVTAFQWHHLIPNLEIIYGWFLQAAKDAGLLPRNLVVRVEWVPPEFESITRLDDARADLLEMRMGKRSPQEVIAKTGRDPWTVLAEFDAWNTAVDQTPSKVVLDSDPRRVANNGQLQMVSSSSDGDTNVDNGGP